jgi:GDPmannose 4,6-dehydratase
MSVKRALIIGITGQDGSFLAEFLLQKGYEVHGIIRRSSSFNTGRISNIFKDPHEQENMLHLHYGDLSDGNSLGKIIGENQFDEIYNLGAQSHVRVSFDIPENTADIVGMGTLKLLEIIKNSSPKSKLYQASSSEMYGEVQEIPQSETTPFHPRSPYGCAKVFAHNCIVNYRESYGLFACNGILFNHESERRGETFVTKKITEGLARIKLGLQKKLFLGNLDAERDWGYAKDYVEAMWLMLQQEKPDDFVIGTGENHKVREFLEEAAKCIGLNIVSNGKKGVEEKYLNENGEVIIEIDPRYFRPSEVNTLLADFKKAKRILWWSPRTSFKELVKIMADFDLKAAEKEADYRTHGENLIKKRIEYSEKNIKLMEDSITQEEINAINECLKSGEYTQGHIVEKFEKKFAEWNGSKYAVMVNSGSSANLLIISALKEKYNLNEKDEILVPNVTWPTTVYPIIQNGLVPVFCDVDESFNMNPESIKRMIGEKTKAIFIVHLLGQPAKMKEIKKICEENNLLLIEDSCESLGAKYDGIKVGNFGIMGSFSFYFGHHMTTLEGGMITTDSFEIYNLLKSLRSHGWIKGTNRENDYPSFQNKNFVFDCLGYNLRSTNINASIGLVQLEKIDRFIEQRKKNHEYFLKRIERLSIVPQKVDINETSSFSFGILFQDSYQREYLLEHLPKEGIECRPIVAGNLLKQPVFSKINLKKDDETMADKIHSQGIYLPNNQFVDAKRVDYMVDTIEKLLNEWKFVQKIQR